MNIMKVLAIVATKRKKGITQGIAEDVLDGAKENGHQVELINLYDYRIEPCVGCWRGVKLGRCPIKDDFESIFEKVSEADALVLATPCYWGNITGVMKNFFDRHTAYVMFKPEEANKFYKLKFGAKLKKSLEMAKKFGPHEPLRGKKMITIVTMTAPFPMAYFWGDATVTQRALNIYIDKMKGKRMGKLVFTDTLFKFQKGKERKMKNKAKKLGQKL